MCGNGGEEGDASPDGRGIFCSPGIWWLGVKVHIRDGGRWPWGRKLAAST